MITLFRVRHFLNFAKQKYNLELSLNRNIKYQRREDVISRTPSKSYVKHTDKTCTSVDLESVRLLERISLVDLGDKDALISLQNSIQFASQIFDVDTSEVNPLYSVLEDQNLDLREDKVIESECRKDIIKNAKVKEEDYFVAPPGNIALEQVEKKIKF